MNILSLFLYLTAAVVIGGVAVQPEMAPEKMFGWTIAAAFMVVVGLAVQKKHEDGRP